MVYNVLVPRARNCTPGAGLFLQLASETGRGSWVNGVLDMFPCLRYHPWMPDADEKLTLADPDDLAAAASRARASLPVITGLL